MKELEHKARTRSKGQRLKYDGRVREAVQKEGFEKLGRESGSGRVFFFYSITPFQPLALVF